MRPRIQIRQVTNHMKYLQEQILIVEPVIEAMKNVVEKSKTWLQDKNSLPSLTYIELQQELDSVSTALLNVSSEILKQDNNGIDDTEPLPPQPTQQTTTQADTAESKGRVQQWSDMASRIQHIETALSSLQDTHQNNEDVISEIKQWRDKFLTQQSEINIHREQSSRKQKQNFKNLRKQMSEQDNKVNGFNKEIESLKEKESKTNKTLEKLSLEMKECENNLHTIKKKIQDHTNKTDSMTKEIKKHSDLISTLQADGKNNVIDTTHKLKALLAKHSIVYKLLQQRLMPIDKMITVFNKNVGDREGNVKKLETLQNNSLILSRDLRAVDARAYNRYCCYIQLEDKTPATSNSIITTFDEVREYNGQHFNQTTGKFVSPHDGLYLVCVTLHEWENKQIGLGVWAGHKWHTFIEVRCDYTNAAGSVVVDMKKGQELYFKVFHADEDAALSYYSSFTIVSL